MGLVVGKGGVVASGHPAVSEAGVAILRRGGNAVDAAVGALFTSFHAEPLLGSPAGGGFLVARVDGEPVAWDFFAAAPGRGRTGGAPWKPEPGAFWGAEVDFGAARQIFHVGPGSVAVPGILAGLVAAQAEAGRLSLAEVLEPGRVACEAGTRTHGVGAFVLTLLEPIIRSDPDFERLHVRSDGTLLQEGDRYRNPDLGRFYDLVARAGGAAPFYTGSVADALVQTVGGRGGGLTREDLATYRVTRGAPLEVRLGGTRVWLPPAPSSGGMLLAYKLALLEGFPPGSPGSREEILLLRACMAQALHARGDILGTDTPTADHAAALLDPTTVAVGRRRVRRLLGLGPRPLPPEPSTPLGSTTHVSVLDAEGNAAAVTVSNGECSGLVLPGHGVFLNNFLGEEDIHPAGFHRVPPGQRLQSSMTPLLVLSEGGAVTALGSGGSNRIRTALLQVVRNRVTHGLAPGDAVRADRLHYEDGTLYGEAATTLAEVLPALAEEGARVALFHGRNMFFGGAHLAERGADGIVRGVGDDRRSGAAAVLTSL